MQVMRIAVEKTLRNSKLHSVMAGAFMPVVPGEGGASNRFGISAGHFFCLMLDPALEFCCCYLGGKYPSFPAIGAL